MKYCTAKKISTQQHLNNELEVISIHDDFDNALKKLENGGAVIEIADDVKRGESINEGGIRWVSI